MSATPSVKPAATALFNSVTSSSVSAIASSAARGWVPVQRLVHWQAPREQERHGRDRVAREGEHHSAGAPWSSTNRPQECKVENSQLHVDDLLSPRITQSMYTDPRIYYWPNTVLETIPRSKP
jgi:hypothetical protein